MATATTRQLTARDLLRFHMADDPQVAPDGTAVAWVHTRIDADTNSYRAAIFTTDLRSGETRQLTAGVAQDTHPRWSPDSRTIAFLAGVARPADDAPPPAASVIGAGPQLHVVAASGGAAVRLTNLLCGVRDIAWSPDGTRIAFTTLVDPAKGLETLASDTPPADPYERFNRDVLTVSRVRWKSDGLGYIGNRYRQLGVVAFAPAADPPPAPLLLTNGAFDLSAAAWSPDGSTLATTGNLDPDGEWRRKSYIYLVNADATTPVAPVELLGLEEMRSSDLAWSPDGTTIAVCGHNDRTVGHYGNQMLWLVTVANGLGRCVTTHIDRAFGDYSRNGDMRRYGGDDGPRWHPDGTSLLVLNNEAGAVHLCRFTLADGSLTPLTDGDCCVVAFSTDAEQKQTVALVGASINPGDIYLLDTSTSEPQAMRRLSDVNGELLAEVKLAEPIRFRCPSRDGTVAIDGWIHAPANREPGKRYPVIL
ncbi:MAG: PD40 domain-containing protein, partial [Chloroflexales bacterium]|nr:PD40 domain-containing protein [Chloroflexales bacterium]